MSKVDYLRKNILFFRSFLTKTPHILKKNTRDNVGLHFDLGNICRRYVGSADQTTVGALFEHWRRKFEMCSVSGPVESVEHILAHCLGTARIPDVYKNKNKILTEEQIKQVESLCSKRLENMPIQYIVGEWSFRHLTLKMSPPVFIPRPETEQLVEIVLPEIARKKDAHILDLCCGSGAIALSLLHERPSIKATCVDQSEAACRLTKHNAQKNGLNKRIRVIQSQLDQWRCEAKFDIVVSNPPYVFSEDLKNLQPEIRFEDSNALDGGAEGLDVIKTILELSSRCLNEHGKLFLEVEPRHPGLLRDYLARNSGLRLTYAETYKDYSGKDRFVQIKTSE